LVFLFVLLHTAFRTASFFGFAVSCILSICPSHLILWHLINLTMFCPLIMASKEFTCRDWERPWETLVLIIVILVGILVWDHQKTGYGCAAVRYEFLNSELFKNCFIIPTSAQYLTH
jgi:hypothetical protein